MKILDERKIEFLKKDIEHFERFEAMVQLLGKPFCFNPLRSAYSELMGPSGLQKMLDSDNYGLKFIKDEKPIILDVGSHVGIFPRVINYRFPKATIYSLEPDRENFYFLQKNNSVLDKAYSFQLGVYDKKSTTTLRESDINSWRSTIKDADEFFKSDMVGNDAFDYGSYEVELIDIDSFIRENNISKLSLLGITVPGEIELKVLEGAVNTLKNLKPLLSVVIYDSQKEKVIDFLKSNDYISIGHSHSMMETFSHIDRKVQI